MNRRLFVGTLSAVPAWSEPLIRLTRADGTLETVDPSTVKASVLIFLSAICPVSNDYQDRIHALIRRFEGRQVRVLLLNSNQNESAEETLRYAEDVRFPVPFYKDWGNTVADRYGVTRTPEAVVLDSGGASLYRGAIDDSRNPARVKNSALQSAVEDVLAGRPVAARPVRAFGCSIKRVT